MSYKTTNDLMQHLRDNGIAISGETQKQQLVTTGYYHGYKGYRFFKSAGARLPFSSYQELYATIQYDSALKALFYGKMMFIETAVKNIALQGILENAQSESISDVLDRVVCSYNNSPANFTVEQKKRAQQNKLNLQRSIQSSLANAYAKGNPKITHFYNNPTYSGVPLWAFFEIMTMGDFGYLLSCLTFPVRKDISTRIGLDLSNDTSCELLFRYIYALKDLRNAIAHNAVVFDTRFRNFDPTKAMKACLRSAIQLPYVNFKTIGDYVILMSYYLKLLQMPNSEILKFIEEFEHITETYRSEVNPAVASIIIHPDLTKRMEILKNCRDIRISAKEVEKLLSHLFFFYPKTARREDDTMKYKHLSYSDRQEMEKLYLQGWHMNDIAAKLGVSLATVYHERARGDTGKMDKNGRGGYSAELAQSKIYARRQELQERH